MIRIPAANAAFQTIFGAGGFSDDLTVSPVMSQRGYGFGLLLSAQAAPVYVPAAFRAGGSHAFRELPLMVTAGTAAREHTGWQQKNHKKQERDDSADSSAPFHAGIPPVFHLPVQAFPIMIIVFRGGPVKPSGQNA